MPPKMYSELASWFHLITAPEDYDEEATFYLKQLKRACTGPLTSVLELGSGGGNNASHMKRRFDMTLVDLSPKMLKLSMTINPELEHVQGDMRSVRLGREFDAVFIHDAVSYMTTKRDLRRAIRTAYVHTRPGGAALFAPDDIVETFEPGTDDGGHDGPAKGDNAGRALRYFEWSYDPNPRDTKISTDYVYIMRERDGRVRVVHDPHVTSLFPRATWLDLLSEAGFDAEAVEFPHSDLDSPMEIFIAKKPA